MRIMSTEEFQQKYYIVVAEFFYFSFFAFNFIFFFQVVEMSDGMYPYDF